MSSFVQNLLFFVNLAMFWAMFGYFVDIRRNGHKATSGLKSVSSIEFAMPNFLSDGKFCIGIFSQFF